MRLRLNYYIYNNLNTKLYELYMSIIPDTNNPLLTLNKLCNKKLIRVITDLRNNTNSKYQHYKDLSPTILTCLSFRGGDKLHSKWTNDEEAIILPFLVKAGIKPVASIVVNLHMCILKYNDNRHLYLKNKWGVDVLMVCRNDANISDEILTELANETLPFSQIGELYGYR